MSPVLDLGKGVFYPVPCLVQFLVVFDFRLSIAAPGNAWVDFPLLETVPDLVGVVAAITDKTLERPISHVGQHLVADVVAGIAAGQPKADGSPLRVPKLVYLGDQPSLASSDGAVAPGFSRHARRSAVGIHEGRVDHPDARLGFLADQDSKDPVPGPVQGLAPEHVASGLVVAVSRWHVLLAASVLQNMKYAVQRLLQVGSLHPSHLGQEGLDLFDVPVGQFADARHGVFSFVSAGTLASRARLAREAHPPF